MSTRTQRLANKFPPWTKTRQDPSSVGQRTFSVFAEWYDFLSAEAKNIKEYQWLLQRRLGLGNIYKIDLDDVDHLQLASADSGFVGYQAPTTVVGAHSTLGDIVLSESEKLEELLWGTPDRVSSVETVAVTDYVIWDNVTDVIKTIAYPDKLMVIISGTTEFSFPTGQRNPLASGMNALVIKGLDINGAEFTEVLDVVDDGTFWTDNIIKDITSVEPEGITGTFSIHQAAAKPTMKDPYRIGSSIERDGPLHYELITDAGGDLLEYSTRIFPQGTLYKMGQTQTPIVDNKDTFWEQHLADSGSTAVTAVDMMINPNDGRLYVIANNGFVHVYDHGPTPFGPPSLQSTITREVFVEIQPIKPWARLGETMTLFTWFRIIRKRVISVEIKRVSPTGVTLYLQANNTWGAGVNTFPGEINENVLPEQTWQDKTFSATFDEYGQWEFYCTTLLVDNTTAVDHIGVMVDRLVAVASIDTTVSTPTAIHFTHKGEIAVADATQLNVIQVHRDSYLKDGRNQALYVRELYDTVTVTL